MNTNGNAKTNGALTHTKKQIITQDQEKYIGYLWFQFRENPTQNIAVALVRLLIAVIRPQPHKAHTHGTNGHETVLGINKTCMS